jgi:hypothetical protein
MFENPTINLYVLCSRCAKNAYCSSELIFTFLHSGTIYFELQLTRWTRCCDTIPRLARWACISLIWKTPWGWHTGVETCRRLILVMNCILLSEFFDWYIIYKNMYVWIKRKLNYMSEICTVCRHKCRRHLFWRCCVPTVWSVWCDAL